MSPGGWCAQGMALAGLVALGQGLGRPLALPVVGGLALAWARRGRGQVQGLTLWQALAALVALGCALLPLLFAVPWGVAGSALLVFLAVHRARTGTGPRDDRLQLILGVLMVLLASTRALSPWMALSLAALVALLPLGLLYTELEHTLGPQAPAPFGRGALVRLVLATLALSVGLFVFIPRLNAQALVEYGERLNQVGFNEGGVDLGGLGPLMDNPELVMRARVLDAQGQPQRGPFYFRGLALDGFDGRRWTATLGRDRAFRVRRPEEDLGRTEPGELRQELQLEPLESPPLFVLPGVRAIYGEERVAMDAALGLRVEGVPRRREVVVLSRADQTAGLGAGGRLPQGYALGLPGDLDPRVGELARAWVGDAVGAEAQALRLLSALGEGYTYTEVPREGLGGQPLSGFLFESREGHCEYFATALAVLLRAVEVPAVVVVGFYGGEWNEVGGYLAVRQQDAHAWVEAQLEDGRWVRLDATPVGAEPGAVRSRVGQTLDWLVSRWHSAVLGYDLDDQLEAARGVAAVVSPGAPAGAPLAAVPAVGAVVLVYTLGIGALLVVLRGVQRGPSAARRRLSPEEKAHRQARALVAKRGWDIPAHLPPRGAARWLRERAGEAAAPLEELAERALAARYGPGSDPDQAAQSWALLRALGRLGRADEVDGAPERR